MSKILPLLMFLLILDISCEKSQKQPILPSILYITGTVTDKQTIMPLDSVSVSLNYNAGTIGSLSIPTMTFSTVKEGKFNFQFSPRENYSYYLFFDKTGAGYKWVSKSVDRNKEHQEINVALEK